MSNITPMSVMAGVFEVSVNAIDLNGTGLASIPLGFQQIKLVTIDGSGVGGGGLGLRAEHVHGTGATVVPLDGSTAFDKLSNLSVDLAGSALGAQLSEGGWLVEGYGGASALSTSSILATSPVDVVGLDGSGQGAVEFVE